MRLKGFIVDIANDSASYYHQGVYSDREEAIDVILDYIKTRGEDFALSDEETNQYIETFKKEAATCLCPEINMYGEIYNIKGIS